MTRTGRILSTIVILTLVPMSSVFASTNKSTTGKGTTTQKSSKKSKATQTSSTTWSPYQVANQPQISHDANVLLKYIMQSKSNPKNVNAVSKDLSNFVAYANDEQLVYAELQKSESEAQSWLSAPSVNSLVSEAKTLKLPNLDIPLKTAIQDFIHGNFKDCVRKLNSAQQAWGIGAKMNYVSGQIMDAVAQAMNNDANSTSQSNTTTSQSSDTTSNS